MFKFIKALFGFTEVETKPTPHFKRVNKPKVIEEPIKKPRAKKIAPVVAEEPIVKKRGRPKKSV